MVLVHARNDLSALHRPSQFFPIVEIPMYHSLFFFIERIIVIFALEHENVRSLCLFHLWDSSLFT
jgi:hypothetical protein